MDLIFRGYHTQDGKLASAQVLQIGKIKPITSIFDGDRDYPVKEMDPLPLKTLFPFRMADCKVVPPDGKDLTPNILSETLKGIK